MPTTAKAEPDPERNRDAAAETAEAAPPARSWRTRLTARAAEAIRGRRTVSLLYKDTRRKGEPHLTGTCGGTPRLLLYQTGGASTSATPEGWKILRLAWIDDFEIEAGRFEPRPRPEADAEKEWTEVEAGAWSE